MSIESYYSTHIKYNIDPETMMITIISLTGIETYSSLVKNLVVSIADTRKPDLVYKAVYPL